MSWLDFDALSHQSTRSLEAVPACAADGKNLKNLGQNYKPMKPCWHLLWPIWVKVVQVSFRGGGLKFPIFYQNLGWSTVNCQVNYMSVASWSFKVLAYSITLSHMTPQDAPYTKSQCFLNNAPHLWRNVTMSHLGMRLTFFNIMIPRCNSPIT